MCHVARSTCHRVNPYENKRWGNIFQGEIAETPNLQGKCALVWNTYHVIDDPEGSKLCPQGAISFFSPMPSNSDAIGPRVTKFGTQVKTNKGYSSIQILGGPKIRGVKILDFRKKNHIHHFWTNFDKIQKMVFKNFWGSKFWIFEILDILKKIPLITILIYKAKWKKCRPLFVTIYSEMIKMNFFRKFKIFDPLIFGPPKFYKDG